jgi:hypothetical protein
MLEDFVSDQAVDTQPSTTWRARDTSKLPVPTPLMFRIRVAARDAAEPFWSAGWRLHDLMVANVGVHDRLRTALFRVDFWAPREAAHLVELEIEATPGARMRRNT